MSAGLVAFLWGVAVFLFMWALLAPIRRLGDERADAGAPGASTTGAAGDDGLFGKVVRPALRNFVPQTPMATQLSGDRRAKVESLLISAGNPWRLTATEYIGLMWLGGLVGGLVGTVAGLVLGITPVITGIVGALLGGYLPRFWYRRARSIRVDAANKTLPEALDLLRITMAAGRQFPTALEEVAGRLPAGIVKNELQRTVDELKAGKPTSRALQSLARRVPAESVEAFARAIPQGAEHGADMERTLESMSEIIRGEYEARIDKRVATLSTVLYLPILVGMVPATFVILIAPALNSMGNAGLF